MIFSHISFKPRDVSNLHILHLESIKTWMADIFLQFNEEKTEVCAPDRFVPTVMETPGTFATFSTLKV